MRRGVAYSYMWWRGMGLVCWERMAESDTIRLEEYPSCSHRKRPKEGRSLTRLVYMGKYSGRS